MKVLFNKRYRELLRSEKLYDAARRLAKDLANEKNEDIKHLRTLCINQQAAIQDLEMRIKKRDAEYEELLAMNRRLMTQIKSSKRENCLQIR